MYFPNRDYLMTIMSLSEHCLAPGERQQRLHLGRGQPGLQREAAGLAPGQPLQRGRRRADCQGDQSYQSPSKIILSLLQWDCMLDMGWNTNTYSDVASLGMCGSSEEDNLMVFAGNLVTSQIIVGDLRARRRTEDLGVATTLPGKAPLTISVSGDVFACACCSDCSILVYR